MRKLVWVAIGFAAVIWIFSQLFLWWISCALACTLLFIFACNKSGKYTQKIRLIFLGAMAAMLVCIAFDYVWLVPARKLDNTQMTLTIEVSKYCDDGDEGTIVEGHTEIGDKTYHIQAYLKENVALAPADTITGVFGLRYTGVGGTMHPTYHRGEGVFLLAYAKDTLQDVHKADTIPLRYLHIKLAREITLLISRLFPEDTTGFALALLLGDDSKLLFAQDVALQITGIRHVIAVSGLHIHIMFAIVYHLCGKQRFLTAVIGFPVLVLFAAVAGFTPSVLRACIMQGLMILAMVVNREYDPPTALATAVLVLLGANPYVIASISFQLSVGCLVGIFLFSKKINEYLLNVLKVDTTRDNSNRYKRWIAASTSVTLGAMATTVPLCATYFGLVSVIQIFTNILCLRIITIIFCGIVLSCALGAIWPLVGRGVAWIVSWPMRYVLMMSDFISRFPGAAVYSSSIYIVVWLVFCYVMLGVFLKNRRAHKKQFAIYLVLGLLASLFCNFLDARQDDFQVTVMDVGQGQCVLLKTRQNTYVVDCGSNWGESSADTAVKELYSRGVFAIDGLIVTHYDKDHAAGVNALASRVPVKQLYLPDISEDNDLRKEIVQANEERISWVRQVTSIPIDSAELTVYPAEPGQNANESSLCILFQQDNYDILITGDRGLSGEEALMEAVELPKLELLVAGHHGSEDSTGLALLTQTRPDIVVISVGADNYYGHPGQGTLERLELFGCRVLRTDLEGTITFRG